MTLEYILVCVCGVLCCQNICAWHWNTLCKDSGSIPKCVEKKFDPYTGRIGLSAVCNQGHYVFSCWGGLWGTYMFWVKGQFSNDCLFPYLLSCDKFLYISIQLLWTRCVGHFGSFTALYSCTDKISLTSVESSSCRRSQTQSIISAVLQRSKTKNALFICYFTNPLHWCDYTRVLRVRLGLQPGDLKIF